MDLLVNRFKELESKNVKVVFSGIRTGLRSDVKNAIDKIEKDTMNNKDFILNICFNFGGRIDIINSAKKIAEDYKNGILDLDLLDEEKYREYLYNSIPDIDLLIRTSGEIRISNFMLYQLAYAEMYFTDVLFPDFNYKEFDKALDAYNKRDRRFGNAK